MRVGVLAVVVIVGTAACSDDASDERLPPPNVERLAPILDPLMADLGLKTTRANLQDPDDPGDETYEGNPEATHLAMYVVPNEDITLQAFKTTFGLWPASSSPTFSNAGLTLSPSTFARRRTTGWRTGKWLPQSPCSM